MHRPDETRRWVLKSASVAILLTPLAACQSTTGSGAGTGASMSATQHLARIRSSNGLDPLSPDSQLEAAAKQQAGYMASAGRMTHRTGWRRDFATRMNRNEVEGAAAENVAHGRMDLDELFEMWMNSAGHRRNMLDPRFRHFGLASAKGSGDGDRYWALVLGR